MRKTPGNGRMRHRGLAVALVVTIVAASCGGSDSSSPEAGSGPVDETDMEGGSESSESAASWGAELATVNLPVGLQLSAADNQTATLNGVGYLVTRTAEGMRLVAIGEDGGDFTEALISGGHAAKVFDSGTQIVMAGLDETGSLVVLSSPDGDTFAEAVIPVPARYVDADVWDATSLIGDAMGVADVDGDLFLIASLGIDWPRAVDVVAQYAYTISEEEGDAARFAGIVKQTPQDGGDFLYEYEADGEIVFAALGSDAGIEPGYRQAADAALDTDIRMFGSWTVSGSTAVLSPEPPFGGGLEDDMRLMALYPVADGAAAVVADFSPEATGDGENATAGQPTLIANTASRVVPVQTGDPDALLEALFFFVGAAITNGLTRQGPIPGTTGNLPDKVEVAADVDNASYQLVTTTGGEMSIYDSSDGKEWESPTTVPLTLPDGTTIELVLTGGGNFLIVFPPGGDDDTPRVFLSDGPVNDDGSLEEVDLVSAPMFEWIGPDLEAEDEPSGRYSLVAVIAKRLDQGVATPDDAVGAGTPLGLSALHVAEILDSARADD